MTAPADRPVVYLRDGTKLVGQAAADYLDRTAPIYAARPSSRKGLRGMRPRPAVVSRYLAGRDGASPEGLAPSPLSEADEDQ